VETPGGSGPEKNFKKEERGGGGKPDRDTTPPHLLTPGLRSERKKKRWGRHGGRAGLYGKAVPARGGKTPACDGGSNPRRAGHRIKSRMKYLLERITGKPPLLIVCPGGR